MNFDAAYAALNPEQKAAVDNIDGPTMVLAGPGTGKTQIIALRIARILQKTQLSPHNILCLTFTESGTVAMRKRLIEMIGSAAYYVRIHTFHSFCNEIIKDNTEKFLFSRDFEPLSDIEKVQVLREILDALPADSVLKPFSDPYAYQRDLEHAISTLKREDITAEKLAAAVQKTEEFIAEKGEAILEFVAINGNSLPEALVLQMRENLRGTFFEGLFEGVDLDDKKARTAVKGALKEEYASLVSALPKQKALIDLYRAYAEALRAKNRYDYDDMILLALNALRSDDFLLARLQEQFQYILVDEYQDTNGAQNELIKLIGDFFENPNIFVVGDDKQSIYRFQGASLENILYFNSLYKGSVNLITLKNNYRSTQVILDAADSLIKHNEQGIHTVLPDFYEELKACAEHAKASVLCPGTDAASAVQLATLSTPQMEHHFVARKVEELIGHGTKPEEIAIIYRTNKEAENFKELFLRMKIPFRVMSGMNILTDKNILNLVDLMRFIADPSRDDLLFFILNFGFIGKTFGFDEMAVLRLIRKANQSREKLFECASTEEKFKEFLEKCALWRSQSAQKTLTEFFEILINESGYLPETLSQPDKAPNLNRLSTFFDQIKSLARANQALTITEFIEHLELLKENNIEITENEFLVQKNAVNLMTAHRSKGLEFEHVFIVGCRDKHFGNNPDRSRIILPHGFLKTERLTRKEKNEDERRLFYVAMTRAKKSLTLSLSQTQESGREIVPSIFTAEIDPKFTALAATKDIENEMEKVLELSFTPIIKPYSAQEEAFVKELLDSYVMSVTHLNNYLACPRLFYYNNLLKVPHAKNEHMSFGTAVHNALRDLLLTFKKEKNLPSAQFLLTQFEKHLRKETLTKKDFERALTFGQSTLTDYYTNYKDDFSPHILTEYPFASHSVMLGAVPITGNIDKITFESAQSKRVKVTDYKTGNPDTKNSELLLGGTYRRQIIFYKLLCSLSQKFPYEMSVGEIDFIQKSKKTGNFVRKIIEVTPEDEERTKSEILSTYEDIMNLKFLRPDEFASCGECEYCKAFNH
jgi:DNA helicase-2/ATP-dependent DNA helicase PcrA